MRVGRGLAEEGVRAAPRLAPGDSVFRPLRGLCADDAPFTPGWRLGLTSCARFAGFVSVVANRRILAIRAGTSGAGTEELREWGLGRIVGGGVFHIELNTKTTKVCILWLTEIAEALELAGSGFSWFGPAIPR